MICRYTIQRGLILIFASVLLSGCARATPTPLFELQVPTSVSAPSLPTAIRPVATEMEPTEEPTALPTASPAAGTDAAATSEGSTTPTVVPTKADPLELPFLMKIDRVSVVPGRGTLLEGRVSHGTLQPNSSVEILGPQNQVLGTSVLATLISTVVRDQVTVGDYVGILVDSIDAAKVTPGMLLSAAGEYPSYEEALQQLQ